LVNKYSVQESVQKSLLQAVAYNSQASNSVVREHKSAQDKTSCPS